jgi:multidrug resistance efflux pump
VDNIADLVGKYGFPIVAAGGMSYMIYYVWTWATVEVKPVLSEANSVLIALIDRIRMLDNDLIRLNQKLNIVLQLRGKEIESERHLEDVKTAANAQQREMEAAEQQQKAAEQLAHLNETKPGK